MQNGCAYAIARRSYVKWLGVRLDGNSERTRNLNLPHGSAGMRLQMRVPALSRRSPAVDEFRRQVADNAEQRAAERAERDRVAEPPLPARSLYDRRGGLNKEGGGAGEAVGHHDVAEGGCRPAREEVRIECLVDSLVARSANTLRREERHAIERSGR